MYLFFMYSFEAMCSSQSLCSQVLLSKQRNNIGIFFFFFFCLFVHITSYTSKGNITQSSVPFFSIIRATPHYFALGKGRVIRFGEMRSKT